VLPEVRVAGAYVGQCLRLLHAISRRANRGAASGSTLIMGLNRASRNMNTWPSAVFLIPSRAPRGAIILMESGCLSAWWIHPEVGSSSARKQPGVVCSGAFLLRAQVTNDTPY
jgi:hypothetical protein